MPTRLIALDEGSDIPVDRTMVVVGRHPQCDARLDSIRVSRRHCCMHEVDGEVEVRDLGSTNGIRINGQRVESGRLRPGDELSIAHIRYRVEGHTPAHQQTLADPPSGRADAPLVNNRPSQEMLAARFGPEENPLAAAVRELLPAGVADRCRIQVIVQMPQGPDGPGPAGAEDSDGCPRDSSP